MAVKQVFNTSAELDFPNVLPTLDLDFANSKTLDPRITFTRASGGSYVGPDGLIKYAGVNEARFDHDPVTGESLGLLVEESRTNITLNSSNTSLWTRLNMISTGNPIILPDGSISTDVEYRGETTDANSKLLRPLPSGAVVEGESWCFSVFLRAGTEDTVNINLASNTGIEGTRVNSFNMITGSISSNIQSGSATDGRSGVIKYPNGWWRVWISCTFGNSYTGFQTLIRLQGFSNMVTRTTSFSAWGAQLERGIYPTSYIPTQASTRTRAADRASITGKNFSEWYRQDEGTIYSSFKFIDNTRDVDINGFGKSILNFIDNSQTERIRFATSALGASISTIWISNSITQATLNSGPYDKNKEILVSSSYKTNNFALSRNNSQQTLNSSLGKVPININTLHIGRSTSNFGYISGTISRITYYPKALPPSQLQSLTL